MSGFDIRMTAVLGVVISGSALAADLDVPGTYATIQDAIDAAVDGDRVMIQPGTYFESIDFDGKQINVRSVDNDPTTVTIDATGLGDHGVHFSGVSTSDAKLSGVTVTGGDHPISGGGIQVDNGDPRIRRCIVHANFANTGGGLMLLEGSPEISQCVFFENGSNGAGASMYLSGSGTPEIINCVLVDNTPGPAYASLVTFTPAAIRNSIIRNNDGSAEIGVGGTGTWDVQYSNIAGGWPGTGNIDAPADFVDGPGRDFHLTATSPCIDAGDNTALPTGIAADIEGNVRYRHDPLTPNTGNGTAPLIDMGVHEFVPHVRYVDLNATGSGDGLTWEDAYTDLAIALFDVVGDTGVDQVWVAAGTYHPDLGTDDPDMLFLLERGLHLHGGFAGGELWLDEKDHVTNETILSGAIGGPGTGDNSEIVLLLDDFGSGESVVDGFIIQKSSMWGVVVYDTDATIRDCWIRLNDGGGFGAGLIGIGLGVNELRLNRCRINRNTDAGGVRLENMNTEIVNCVIAVNDTYGGIFADDSELTIINSTIYGNESFVGGGVHAMDGETTIRNSIIWGNLGTGVTLLDQNFSVDNPVSTDVTYTTIEGADHTSGGVGTNGVDPQFVDLDGANDFLGDADDDFRLSAGSHAIDSGSNDGLEDLSLDWFGATRFMDDSGMPDSGVGPSPVIDRGAVEFDGSSCAYDCNDDGTVDVLDLLFLLGAWGDVSDNPVCDYAGEAGGDGWIDVLDLLGMLGAWGGC